MTWFPLEDSEDVRVKQLPGDTAEEEGLVMAMVDWSVQFEGAVQCTGEFE